MTEWVLNLSGCTNQTKLSNSLSTSLNILLFLLYLILHVSHRPHLSVLWSKHSSSWWLRYVVFHHTGSFFQMQPLLFLTVVKAQLYASGTCDWEILSSKDSRSLVAVNPTRGSMNVLWISLFHGRTVVFCILLWSGLLFLTFPPCCNIFGSY